MRHFLRLIDLDSEFNNHGFVKKVSSLNYLEILTLKLIKQVGAAFKLNEKPTACKPCLHL